MNETDRSARTASLTESSPDTLETSISTHCLGECWHTTASRNSLASWMLRTGRFPDVPSRKTPWRRAVRRDGSDVAMMGCLLLFDFQPKKISALKGKCSESELSGNGKMPTGPEAMMKVESKRKANGNQEGISNISCLLSASQRGHAEAWACVGGRRFGQLQTQPARQRIMCPTLWLQASVQRLQRVPESPLSRQRQGSMRVSMGADSDIKEAKKSCCSSAGFPCFDKSWTARAQHEHFQQPPTGLNLSASLLKTGHSNCGT